jgi:cysteine desulfurase
VFPGVPNELVVQAADLRGIAISAGAACASGSTEPSPVLTAMGDPDAGSGIRISQGPQTSMQDIDALLAVLAEVIPALGGLDEVDA